MFGTAAMREVFGDRGFLARCVEVEAALARAQARLGIIPKDAAAAISRAADPIPELDKIVTTIGPATRSVEGMIELIEAGADVFRFNFSHGTRDDHAENVAMAREAAERSGKEVGILGDLPGPKLRIGDVEAGIVGLRPGSEIVLTTEDCIGTDERLSVSYDGLPEAVTADGLIYLADGRIRLRVLEAGDDEVRCSVEVGGRISSHQGLNLPGAEVGLPAAGREDLAWVDFAVAHDIDLLAVSFVRRAEDLAPSSAGCAPGAPTSR